MTPNLSDELLGRLSAFVTEVFGLRFPPDRWAELARGVASAALELGISDLSGWAAELSEGRVSAEHLTAVSNHLTISETHFFRHPDTFTLLEQEILPARIQKAQTHAGALRLWSAGCASGEEPYSLAILLRRAFPQFPPERIAIYGTDLNSRVLGRATRGIYTEWSFRDVPAWLKPSFFTRTANGRYQVTEEIRTMVRFTSLNLAAPFYPPEFSEGGRLDVILCRNVLMYFATAWQEKIIARLAGTLAVGGWLLVGPCDITAAQAADLHLEAVRPGAYRKPSPEEKRAIVAVAPAVLVFTPLPTVPSAPTVPSPVTAHELMPPAPVVAQPTPLLAESAASVLEAEARQQADRGELELALKSCDAAIALEGMNAELHHLRGCVLLELERPLLAEDAFRRVLYLDPEFTMAQFALGSLAQQAGRERESKHHFSQVLRSLAKRQRGDTVPHSEGLIVARLQDVVERTLREHAA